MNRSVVGFPRESSSGDRRTLLTPRVASALRAAGFDVLTEHGIGEGVFCNDAEISSTGARFADPDVVWAAPLVLRYKSPDPGELSRLHPGQSIGALFRAEGDPALMTALTAQGVTAYSYEFLHDNDRFPLAAPGGEIAGVQAVFHGAAALQSPGGGRGVLIAAVAGAPHAHVVVIGCGNVGAAAAGTASALGAQVTVLAHSSASADRYRTLALASVEVVVNTTELRREVLAEAELVIGAILESTWDTPAMITASDLSRMRTGAVIVDATCGYGEGYLPTVGPVQQPGAPHIVDGIVHIKLDLLPSLVPVTTTSAYTACAAPYLVRLARVACHGVDDPVVDTARIAHAGHLVHPVCLRHMKFYQVPA
ncbi:NAD(P)-dependent oxidoreductase [Nocardia sp. NPDC052278]|uniref:NAD(P)-dependent oxidoreductase n=1 Tax=unclassified Nocardia TaxID=2637762 RepID=UPI0036C27F2E